MTIRQAIKKTRDLHQLVLDGKYRDYQEARRNENGGHCYLCQACGWECALCPWVTIEEYYCTNSPNGESFDDSEQSVARLDRWLLDPRTLPSKEAIDV